MKILKAEDLCFSYQNKYQTVEAVKNVTCDFAAGRAYAIVGKSGSDVITTAVFCKVERSIRLRNLIGSGTAIDIAHNRNHRVHTTAHCDGALVTTVIFIIRHIIIYRIVNECLYSGNSNIEILSPEIKICILIFKGNRFVNIMIPQIV